MNDRIYLVLILAVVTSCSGPTKTPSSSSKDDFTTTIRPDSRLRGQIQSVNQQAQYAIVDFGLGAIPPLQTKMNVYRNDAVVAVLTLTGPVRNSIVAADIVSGEAKAGDVAIWEQPKKEDDGVK